MTQKLDPALRTTAAPVDSESKPKPTLPVNVFAFLGVMLVIFECYVLIKWVTGPFFARVPSGPSEPPALMQGILIAWQVGSIPATLGLTYWYVIRPWMRDRKLGIDGILVISFLTVWFQDPLSSYGGHWFTYNTWMINFGSWVNSVPGWNSYGKPGAMLSEPILFTPFAYSYIFVIVMLIGSWFMRTVRRRYPTMSNLGLIASCYAFMMVFDFVLEGLLWLPMGIFAYQGGHWGIFPNTYHKFPVHEALTIGAVFCAVACLRYFLNDKGQMVFERGVEDVRGGEVRKTTLRAFAAIFAIQGAMFLGYNVPNFWVGMHSTEWNQDIQKRSYFTSGICGENTNRPCPGPAVPLDRNNNSNPTTGSSAYVDKNGQGVIPPDAPWQRTVIPFDRPSG
jgi:hypothetical protein